MTQAISADEIEFLRTLNAGDLQKIMETLSPEEQKELEYALEDITIADELKDPADWIQKNFFIPELNGPIVLAEYQQRCLREAFRKDEKTGLYIYSTVVWSDIKKSAKSTITAAAILYVAHGLRYGKIQIVANDLKQADSRVGYYMRLAIDLNRKWKKEIAVKPSGYLVTLPNKTEIESIPIDPTGEAGGNSDMIVYSELWGANSKAQKRMWCYDDQTEILTKRGWIKGVDLAEDDTVATVSPATHNFMWQKIKGLYKAPYSGKMHLYENKHFSECVTPNHRLYGKFGSDSKTSKYVFDGIMRSDELRASGKGIYWPLTNSSSYYSGNLPDEVILPATKFKPAFEVKSYTNWFYYLGWYLTEGRIKHNGDRPCSVYISQSPTANPDKWQKLVDLHNDLFTPTGWRISGQDHSDFVVDSSELAKRVKSLVGTGTKEKFISESLKDTDAFYLTCLLDAFFDGDGHRTVYQSNSIQVPVGNKRLADDLCEVGFKLGYSVSIREQKPKDKPNHFPYWRLNFVPLKDGYEHEVAKRHGHWQEIDYDGLVWCPSTDNGLLVVRRKGKIYVSGNTEATLPPAKFGRSMRWVESYAGIEGESETLEMLYETGVKNGVQLWPDLEAYANPAARMFVLWNTIPRLKWQTPEYYASEAGLLTPSEFDRVHRNKWSKSVRSFVPSEWVDSCRGLVPPALVYNEPLVVGIDAGTSSDSFAISAVSITTIEVGEYSFRRAHVRFAYEWIPEPGEKLQYSDPFNLTTGKPEPRDPLRPAPETVIRDLAEKYHVVMFVYDPYQLHNMANNLTAANVGYFVEMNQNMGGKRAKADKNLFDLIRDRRISIGDDRVAQHIKNANASTESDGLRLKKRNIHSKIDLAVATSMACFEAFELNLG